MREVIYKGATRPPMKWGVPLGALVLLLVPSTLLTVWTAFLLNWFVGKQGLLVLVAGATIVCACYGWMRWVTSKDDQRMAQMLLAIWLALLNRSRRLNSASGVIGLGGLRSYSAYRARGAHHAWRR